MKLKTTIQLQPKRTSSKKTKRQLFAAISTLVFVLCFVSGDLNNKVLPERAVVSIGKKSKKGGK